MPGIALSKVRFPATPLALIRICQLTLNKKADAVRGRPKPTPAMNPMARGRNAMGVAPRDAEEVSRLPHLTEEVRPKLMARYRALGSTLDLYRTLGRHACHAQPLPDVRLSHTSAYSAGQRGLPSRHLDRPLHQFVNHVRRIQSDL